MSEISEVPQEKQFVRRGMCAKCSWGNMEYQYLNLPKDHGVYFQNVDQPLMNANDHVSGKHILQFGRCTAPGNPENWLDTLVSKSSNPILKWIDETVDGIQQALGCDGCKCKPMLLNSWKEGDEANRLDGAPAITSESKVFCMYGGEITITEEPKSNDTNEEEQNQEGQGEEQKEKDPMDTIPAAMKDKINKKNEKAIEEYNAAMEAIDAAIAEANTESNSEMQGTSSETQAGAEIDLSMIPEDVLAMLTDTELWYKENPTEFVETNRVSEQIMEQNYMHNRTQIIDSACLNDEGYIIDSSLLFNFNMASSNVSKIGKSCAASYNLMHLIDDSISLPTIIREMEMMQTCPGYMDGGPLSISMLCMGEMMENRGFATTYGYGNNAFVNWDNMECGEIGVWGMVEAGETNFYTFVTDEQGYKKCLEKPERNLEDWANKVDNTQNMFIKVKR